MKYVIKLLIPHSINSVIDVEKFSVSTLWKKETAVLNPIPLILDIITVPLVWMISSFAGSVGSIEREGDVSPLKNIFVSNVEKN